MRTVAVSLISLTTGFIGVVFYVVHKFGTYYTEHINSHTSFIDSMMGVTNTTGKELLIVGMILTGTSAVIGITTGSMLKRSEDGRGENRNNYILISIVLALCVLISLASALAIMLISGRGF